MKIKKQEKKITRSLIFTIAIFLIFLTLGGRLFYIQVVKGDYYRGLAEDKGEKEIVDPAPRGEILDSNGNKIATSKEGYNITYSNYQTRTKEKTEDSNKRINKSLIETIRVITKTNPDKLNLSSIPIVLENDKYVYNFTATSKELRAKQEQNFKKNFGINEIEDKLSKDQGKKVSLTINQVVRELEKKYGIVDKETGKKNYKLSKLENYQLIALRAAISEISYSQYKSVYIAKNVEKDTALRLMAKEYELTGIGYEVAPIREYPYKDIGASVVGYLGKIDEDSSEKFKSLGYDINRELTGKLGLERALENNTELGINLRGEPGVKYVNVDKLGQITKETATLDPIPGDSVKLSIDMELNKVAEESLDKTMKSLKGNGKAGNSTRGAAIVTNIKTGEILALASRPGYNPNDFSETGSLSDTELYKQYFVPEKNEGDKYDMIAAPMFNYATKGAVPPGSIFKPFLGVAGIEEGVVSTTEHIYCAGQYTKAGGGAGHNCWIYNQSKGQHGPKNIVSALEVSCNIFFYETAHRLGEEKFNKWMTKFGLTTDPETGEKPRSGIEIEESPGAVGTDKRFKDSALTLYLNDISKTIADIGYGGYTITKGTEEYKILQEMFSNLDYKVETLDSIGINNIKAQKYIKQNFNNYRNDATGMGQLLNASIGQGSTLLTPIQMISALNTVLNDGTRYSTHLVKEVLNPDGSVKKEIKPEVVDKVPIAPETKNSILQGMSNVTSGEHGTAVSTFKGFDMKTGGKTGSASVSKVQRDNGRRAYGWFMGFAPFDNPEISVIVVIYDAESGGSAAPVARDIYEKYFKLKDEREKSDEDKEEETKEESQDENSKTNEDKKEKEDVSNGGIVIP